MSGIACGRIALAFGSTACRRRAVNVGVLIQILRGLAALEARGIQHHDVKPENILLSGRCRFGGDCRAVLADFGAACASNVPGFKPCGLDGTRRYASPEWAQSSIDNGARGWFPKGDVWAAGLVAFELLVGRFPMEPIVDWEQHREFLAWRAQPAEALREGEADEWRHLLAGMLQTDEIHRLSARQAYELSVQIAADLGILEPAGCKLPEVPPGLFSGPAANGLV